MIRNVIWLASKTPLQDILLDLREVRWDESQAIIGVDSCVSIQESHGEVGQTSDFASHLPAVPTTFIVGYVNFGSSSESARPETRLGTPSQQRLKFKKFEACLLTAPNPSAAAGLRVVAEGVKLWA